MKKTLFLLLVFLTSFQLSGGYAVVTALSTTSLPFPVKGNYPTQQTFSQKHFPPLHFLNQLLSQEETEEEDTNLWVHLVSDLQNFYSFVPIFSVQNKHFLIHYAASIKGKLPPLYLLHNIFRL